MKKIKVFSLVLLGAVFGLTSCDLPDFLYSIPGVSNLLPAKEQQKEEKNSEEEKPANQQEQTGDNGENNNQNQNNNNNNNNNNNDLTEEASDTLNRGCTGVANGSSSYTDWTYTAPSKAEYAGKSAGSHDSIQIRSKDKDSGIVTTKSAGKITSVSVEWNDETLDARVLNVYVSDKAYSKPTDLFGSNKGTLAGTIDAGDEDPLEISGDYQYVGICSSDGAMYLNSVTFNWNGAGGSEKEVLDEFPLNDVKAVLEGGSSEEFPIPTGTSFEFEIDKDYENSCFVKVHGGDLESYVEDLVTASFAVDDQYAEYGYYYCLSEGETLVIEIQADFDDEYNVLNTEFELTIFAVQLSHEFPQTEVDEFLASKGISETYPIPEGTTFQHEYDDEYDCYLVYVYGGSSTEYMQALETALFTKYDDYYDEYGCYVFIKGDLDIDVYPIDVDEGLNYYQVSFMLAE